jgi:hypothetical protein
MEEILWKISQFLESFEENCRKYYICSSDLALDEMMVRFSGVSNLTYSQQPKPTPNGLKMIALVDSKMDAFMEVKLVLEFWVYERRK